jgi:hypothetical protein
MFILDQGYGFSILDPGSGGQKYTGFRIRGSKRHRIPDPEVKKAPDPGFGSAALKLTNNLSICYPFYEVLGNMIRDVFF